MSAPTSEVLQPAADSALTLTLLFCHLRQGATYATNLRSLGVDVTVAQEMLRHANSRITLDIYTQAASMDKRRAASRIAGLLDVQHPPSTLEKGALPVSY